MTSAFWIILWVGELAGVAVGFLLARQLGGRRCPRCLRAPEREL